MGIYEKLMNIQQELKAPKEQHNNYGDYNYRSCEDIQEAVKPLLKKNKAVLVINDELELIGSRYYLKATASLIDTEDGSQVTNTAYARETDSKKGMDEAQITGSCSSYARKYALNGLFCIDDTKDPDTQKPDNERQQTGREYAARVGKKEIDELLAEAYRTNVDISQVCERYGVNIIQSLTMQDYKRALSVFRKMPTVYREE